MNETIPPDLHTLAALLVAVLAVLFVAGKIGSKFLDDWWDKGKPRATNGNGNGNGDTRKVCFLGEGGAERIVERLDDHHDRLREAIHQNHASTLAILTQLSQALDSRRDTEKDIAITLKLIERHMAEAPRR